MEVTNVQPEEFTNMSPSNFENEKDEIIKEVEETVDELKSKKSSKEIPSVLTQTWIGIQNSVKDKIIVENTELWQNNFTMLKYVAGLDIQSTVYKEETIAVPTIVICSYPSLKVVYEKTAIVKLTVPYVPGFLAFRDADPLVEIVKKAIDDKPEFTPDLILAEGNGVLHPRRCGSACHIGHELSIPTIGVAKNFFFIRGTNYNKKKEEVLKQSGDSFTIIDKDKKPLGMAVKSSSSSKKAIFVSVGNKISLETAKNAVLSVSKFRIPEPLRYAETLSRSTLKLATKGAKFVETEKGAIKKGNLVDSNVDYTQDSHEEMKE